MQQFPKVLHAEFCFAQYHSAKTVIFRISGKCKQFAITPFTLKFHFALRLKHGVMTLFTIASIADAKKRPWAIKRHNLSTGVETVVFRPDDALRGRKLKKNSGREIVGFWPPNELDHAFWFPVYGAKFHQNWVRIATVRKVTDKLTDRHTHT